MYWAEIKKWLHSEYKHNIHKERKRFWNTKFEDPKNVDLAHGFLIGICLGIIVKILILLR